MAQIALLQVAAALILSGNPYTPLAPQSGVEASTVHLCVTPVTTQSGAASRGMTSQLVNALGQQPLDKKKNAGSIQVHAVGSDPTEEALQTAGCPFVVAAAFSGISTRLPAEQSRSQYERRASSPRYQPRSGYRMELRLALWRVGTAKPLWTTTVSDEAREDRSSTAESLVDQAAERIAGALNKRR